MINKLGLVLIFILMSGAALAYINYKTNKRIFYFTVITTALVTGLCLFLIQMGIERMHKKEIKKVIENKNGVVISVNRINDTSRVIETSQYNTIYEIKYKNSKGEIKTAWYRAIKSTSDIHKKRRKGLSESWVFS